LILFSSGENRVRELKQPRAIATRESIIGEAARLFALKGYHDTRLEEVFSGARVTTGAFFHHFKSKEDLGFAVINAHMEKRRKDLDRIEKRMDGLSLNADPLQRLMLRLDAIKEMVHQRKKRKGGCIIGNLSTSLSDTHNAFRRRLAGCFDEMALEFKPYLDVAVKQYRPGDDLDTWALARYIVGIVEGSIMLARTGRDGRLMEQNFDFAKNHIKSLLGVPN
jgi:TetR/AcrR family transcriptional repressor of nem operon